MKPEPRITPEQVQRKGLDYCGLALSFVQSTDKHVGWNPSVWVVVPLPQSYDYDVNFRRQWLLQAKSVQCYARHTSPHHISRHADALKCYSCAAKERQMICWALREELYGVLRRNVMLRREMTSTTLKGNDHRQIADTKVLRRSHFNQHFAVLVNLALQGCLNSHEGHFTIAGQQLGNCVKVWCSVVLCIVII